MKVYPADLDSTLARQLHAMYIVSGDEPLQQNEVCDAIRAAAKKQNYTERHVLNVDKGFDWEQFLAISNSMSLFADRQLIELRMPTGKPGDVGTKVLTEYAENPSPDCVVVLICGKIEKQTQKTKWFTQLEGNAVFIQIWPIEVGQLSGWIQNRARSKGMKLTPAAVQFMVDSLEGNMLAASQELDKLFLLYGDTEIDDDAVIDAVSDSARYDLFGLVDTSLSGDAKRVARMMHGLRGEGVEPVLVTWALSREIRSLIPMAVSVSSGKRPEQVVSHPSVWAKRKPLVAAALKRHSATNLQHMLQHAAKIDRIIKGLSAGNVWDELLQLALSLAGVQLFPNMNTSGSM
ncbi:DNA polymerase III subunit delta [Kaarinaea lacus]